MIQIGCKNQIPLRNLKRSRPVNRKIGGIAGREHPRAFQHQLTRTDCTRIAEADQNGRLIHKQHGSHVSVKFLRQEHITQLMAVIECRMFKFRQSFRYGQCHQTGIISERIAAKAQHAERYFKFCLIRHFGQCITADYRMSMHCIQALGKIRTLLADFRCKDTLLDHIRIGRRYNRKQRIRRSLRITGITLLIEDYIDFNRTVKDRRKLLLKPLRNGQIGQSSTAGKRHISDFFYRIRYTECHKRIAVREQIGGNLLQGIRQTDLLILTGCCKGIRSEIADRVRQNQTVRAETAGKGIHINDLQAFRQNNMYQFIQSGKRICTDPAQ